MGRVIVVEVLNRRGDVTQRVRLASFPATIGRAWSGDVVLGDPMVDAVHARIVADEAGGFALEDAGSVNGLFAGGSRQRTPRVALDGVTTVRLGRTVLRLARADQPVPAAIPDQGPRGRLATLLASPPRMLAIHAAGLLLMGLITWLGNYDKEPGAKVMTEVLGVLLLVCAWAGTWALVGRIRIHQANFSQHSTLTWLTVIAMTVVGEVQSFLDFLFPSASLLNLAFTAATIALGVALIVAQLGLVSAAPRRRRLAWALAATAGLGGLGYLAGEAAKHDFEGSTVTFNTALFPVSPSLVPSESVEEFLQKTNKLKNEVDSRRQP